MSNSIAAPGRTVSTAKTPQAKNDVGAGLENDTIIIDALQNDLGGQAKQLYSLNQANPLAATSEDSPVTLSGGSTIEFQNGQIAYNANGKFDYLAAGETATETFTYAIRLGNGTISTATVTLTITGTNDAPVINEGLTNATALLTETADGAAGENAGLLEANGSIAFTDLDTSDIHSASVAPQSSGYIGSLTLAAVDQASDQISWSFQVPDALLDSLAAGETRVQNYDVTISDGAGGIVVKTISVTLTGTNDAPVVTAAVDAGTVTEDTSPSTAGTIQFSDADLSDGHYVGVTPNAEGYTGTFTVAMGDSASGDGDGSVNWSYTLDPDATQKLAAGQSITQSYTITIYDTNGGTTDQLVSVTITGTNDVPIITGGDNAGSVTETEPVAGVPASATPVVGETQANDAMASAQLIDRDALRVAPNANLGDQSDPSITVAGTIATTSDNDWYAIELKAGEILTLDVDFAAGAGLDSHVFLYDASGNLLAENDDAPTSLGGAGSSRVQDSYVQYTVPVSGTYYIKMQDFDGFGQSSAGGYSLQLSIDSQGLLLTDSGELAFADIDLTDGHGITATPLGGGYLGSFQASVSDASSGDGSGKISWDFAVENAAVQYLAEGQVLTQTYEINVDDGNGGSATDTVSVTITGTNDVPILSASGTSATYSEDATVATTGVVAFADVDLTDSHSVTFEPAESGYAGSFSVEIADASTGDGAGQLSWSFSADGSAFQSLRDGQTVLQRYVVTVSDGNGGTTQQLVNVTITGTNDAPMVVGDTSGTNEDTAISIDVLANDSDVDGGTLSIASVSGTSVSGAAVSVVNGQIQYDPTTSAQLQALNAGQTVTDTFTYAVSDGQGGTTTATGTVVVEGVADGGAVDDTFATGEDNRLYLDVLANDVSANGKAIVGLNGTGASTATTSLGAEIQIFNGKIFYNPQNAAAIQALDTGQTAADSFTYSMMDGSGNITQATVTMNVSGFTEGTVIDSGITGVMTFDSANPWSTPQSFTEAGMTVQSLYDPNSSPHLHFNTSYGDSSVELWNHSGCCSTPYEFRYFNPDNGDTTFSLQSFDHFGGAGVWTTSKGGSVAVSDSGTIDFSSNAAFQDVEWVRWDPTGYSGNDYIDNFTFSG